MTVRRLIAALAKLPPGAAVWTEGCDCIGPATHAILDEDGTVLLTRPRRESHYWGSVRSTRRRAARIRPTLGTTVDLPDEDDEPFTDELVERVSIALGLVRTGRGE